MGLAMAGQKPVCEIQFCDYAFNTIDLLKLAGGMYWSSNGQYNLPLTMMTPVGSGIHGSLYHSHSFDAQATRTPGWKIVIPSNPRDAYGMLLSAIADPNPVMFLAPKALLRAKALPGEEIPGEPADERTLNKMIDAPLGDRAKWAPQWAGAGRPVHPARRGAHRQDGHAADGRDLRAHGAGLYKSRRGAGEGRHLGRGDRPALAASVRLEGDHPVGEEDEPASCA